MKAKLKLILAFVERGCALFPVIVGGKKPAVENGVKAASKNRDMIRRHFSANPRLNYGIATGAVSKIFVVDLDGPEGVANFRQLEAANGRSARTVTVRTPNGWHLYFQAPEHRILNSVGRIADNIDIRGDGGYVVGPGSSTPNGVYRFTRGRGLADVEIAEAPAWLLKRIVQPVALANESAEPAKIPKSARELAVRYAEAARQREMDRLRKAPQHQRNDTLNRCGFRLGQFLPYGLLDRNVVAEQLVEVALRIGLDAPEIRPTIESGLTAGSRHPRRLPFLKNSAQRLVAPRSARSTDNITEQLAKLGETDTDNAQRFATRFGRKLIYTPGKGWLVFDGVRYKAEATLQCLELAKKTARLIESEVALQADEKARHARAQFAKQSLSKASLERMLDLARGLLAVEDATLDSDPMLLNTLTGTIDLRTGKLDKHDARDLLTKVAPVFADPKAKCHQFKTFLRLITGGDIDLMRYLWKCIGYSLTGSTSEQALFFAYGKSGNNGKSTLINLIREMLGDYGCHTPTETLVVKQYDNAIPADLARLAGARMVTAIEANFNRHLDEARIKAMTGGEPVTARFMRQNFFEFTPVFKLWLVANDRPRVRHTDNAFWRRVRVLPFTVEIAEADRDKDLGKKLRAEWPGILAWAVRGCLRWQAEGLVEPDCVRSATSDWKGQVDHLRRFGDECLVLEPQYQIFASGLYEAYGTWCRKNGEQALSMRDFKHKVSETFDLAHKRINGRSVWKGVKLK